MKIEKINDSQIRCTLTVEDLQQRHLKLAELAYGTEKAKSLFREMLSWAATKFGFYAEDIPLMIEAVPITEDSIMLIVTKVEYPEELDTRFSNFTEDEDEYDDDDLIDMDDYDEYGSDLAPATEPASASDIIDLFKRAKEVAEGIKKLKEAGAVDEAEGDETNSDDETNIDITKLFTFKSLETIINLSHVLGDFYHGQNAIYKDNKGECFYLIISKSDHTPEEFNKVCNIVSEYGTQEALSVGSEEYFAEHYHPLLINNALETLASL